MHGLIKLLFPPLLKFLGSSTCSCPSTSAPLQSFLTTFAQQKSRSEHDRPRLSKNLWSVLHSVGLAGGMQIVALRIWNIIEQETFKVQLTGYLTDGRKRAKISDSDSTDSTLDSKYPSLLVMPPSPYTKGINSMFLLQVWRSSFHRGVLRLPWRTTISRRLRKIGLSPCLFTENELRDDTKQDHVDCIHAYCWQALPIVSSTCMPHTGTHARTNAMSERHVAGWVRPWADSKRWSIRSLQKRFLGLMPAFEAKGFEKSVLVQLRVRCTKPRTLQGCQD